MFGVNDNTQQSNDDPAMLDNVKQLASQPADQVMPSASPAQDTPPTQPTPVAAPAQDATSTPPTPVSASPEQTPPAPVGPPQPVATPAAGFSTGDNDEHPADETPQAATPEVNSAAPPAPITSPHQGDTAATNPTDELSESADNTTEKTEDTQAEQQTVDTPETASEEPASPSAPVAPVVAPDANHLAGLKKQALEHLEPLSDHIDGTPEETFKTTMMMIQANDNHTLLEKALAAAQKIEDDKVRAQAMLDIINEINYFSQATGESPSGDSDEAN